MLAFLGVIDSAWLLLPNTLGLQIRLSRIYIYIIYIYSRAFTQLLPRMSNSIRDSCTLLIIMSHEVKEKNERILGMCLGVTCHWSKARWSEWLDWSFGNKKDFQIACTEF